jgi:hypothetical protein
MEFHSILSKKNWGGVSHITSEEKVKLCVQLGTLSWEEEAYVFEQVFVWIGKLFLIITKHKSLNS